MRFSSTSNAASKESRRRGRRIARRALLVLLLLLLLAIIAYAANAAIGMRAAAQTSGTLRVSGLLAPVRIVRDARDIAHIEAGSERDAFFAQGYAEASDRLFQMDLLRRYVYGRLAEILGPVALSADENARVVDIRRIAQVQWQRLDARDRALVQAFSDGVNAAMRMQPLPIEFRLLLYKPAPWRPQDSLAVGMATALDLIDPWSDVIRRDAVVRALGPAASRGLYSITDPAYDAPMTGRTIAPVTPLPTRAQARAAMAGAPHREPLGSNEWAVGAAHSKTGGALLANDPHLRLQIPGVWYLVDLHAGDFHVAGASLAGTPGVILGHNQNLAWGATNGTVVTEVVYRDPLAGARKRIETFHVRFGRDVRFTYETTRHGFVAETSGKTAYAVDWNAARSPFTPLVAFEELDRAPSIARALDALRAYPGPPQNFVLADRSGRVAYHLAGLVPRDPSWGMRVHKASDPSYPFIPFQQLPHVGASRSALLFTANNRMYGAGYPYRLSAFFAPPYRAHRIRALLRSQKTFAVADFARFQGDTFSPAEYELAHELLRAAQRTGARRDPRLQPYLDAVARWNGRFDPGSVGAAIVREVRRIAAASLGRYDAGSQAKTYEQTDPPIVADHLQLVLLMRVLRERPRGWWPHGDYDALLVDSLREAVRRDGTRLLLPWGRYDPIPIRHPLSALGFRFLNGATLPGDGDSYTIHVQNMRDTQSFRAVWDLSDWDRGGIAIPSGESGEPGSSHYTDLSRRWIAGALEPLPFSAHALAAATRETLTLLPK